MARRWTAVLARLGTPTGDGRVLSPGGITSRNLPLPLSWQRESGDGHGGSVVVGRIESIDFSQDMVTATGSMLDSPEASEAAELVDAGVIGPSVDLDDLDFIVDDSDRVVVTSARIAGATLVAIPAFADVSLTLAPLPAEPEPEFEHIPEHDEEDRGPLDVAYSGLVASVRTGWSALPLADESRAWDGDAAAGRVAAWAGVDAEDAGAEEWGRYARAFLRRDDDANPQTRGAYSFGIADVIDGTLTIVPRGVFAAAAAIQGARTGREPAEADAMRSALNPIYERLDRTPPWAEDDDASLQAAAAPQLPPLEWFTNPKLDGPTPLTVTDEGHVFGHVAPWGACHVGLPGCVTPPASATQYAHFLLSEQETADGTRVPVGNLTVGGGHADPKLGFRAAAEHYDDVGAQVAKVFAGEDEHGIWVAGWILPTADPAKVETFKASPVSGDWRRIGGNLELIAVCAVNSPGFPVLRRVSFSLEKGGQQTLIGQFTVRPRAAEAAPVENGASSARAKWAQAQWRQKGRD